MSFPEASTLVRFTRELRRQQKEVTKKPKRDKTVRKSKNTYKKKDIESYMALMTPFAKKQMLEKLLKIKEKK